MSDMAEQDANLTVAGILGVDERRIRYGREQGMGPHSIRLAHRTVRYEFGEVVAWVREREAS